MLFRSSYRIERGWRGFLSRCDPADSGLATLWFCLVICALFSGCAPSPILALVESEDVTGIAQFYKQGGNPNAVVARGGTTPLMHAFLLEKKSSYTTLLQSGADPNAECGDDLTIMHYAASVPDSFWLKEALRFKGDPNLVNSKASNYRKGTVLWFAIRGKHVENAKVLLDAGAELNGIVHNGMTPLSSALRDPSFEIAILLLNRGADCLFPAPKADTALFNLKQKLRILKLNKFFSATEVTQLKEIEKLFKEKGCDPEKAEWNGGNWEIKK